MILHSIWEHTTCNRIVDGKKTYLQNIKWNSYLTTRFRRWSAGRGRRRELMPGTLHACAYNNQCKSPDTCTLCTPIETSTLSTSLLLVRSATRWTQAYTPLAYFYRRFIQGDYTLRFTQICSSSNPLCSVRPCGKSANGETPAEVHTYMRISIIRKTILHLTRRSYAYAWMMGTTYYIHAFIVHVRWCCCVWDAWVWSVMQKICLLITHMGGHCHGYGQRWQRGFLIFNEPLCTQKCTLHRYCVHCRTRALCTKSLFKD